MLFICTEHVTECVSLGCVAWSPAGRLCSAPSPWWLGSTGQGMAVAVSHRCHQPGASQCPAVAQDLAAALMAVQLSQGKHKAFSRLRQPCKQGANCPVRELGEIYYFMSLELWQIAPWLPSVRVNVLFCPASFSLISESFLAHISMCGS